MAPACTAVVPHGSVGTVHLRPGKLDAYGLPDFDDMDFDGEAMPIADKPQPKSSRQTGGILCSGTELNLRSSGVLCSLDRASHSTSPTYAATSTPKKALRTSPAAMAAIKGSPPKLKILHTCTKLQLAKVARNSSPLKTPKGKSKLAVASSPFTENFLHTRSASSGSLDSRKSVSAARMSDADLEKLDAEFLGMMEPVTAAHHGVIGEAKKNSWVEIQRVADANDVEVPANQEAAKQQITEAASAKRKLAAKAVAKAKTKAKVKAAIKAKQTKAVKTAVKEKVATAVQDSKKAVEETAVVAASAKASPKYELDPEIDYSIIFNNVADKRLSMYSSFYKKYRNIAHADGFDKEQCSSIAREMGTAAVAAWRKQEGDEA